MRPTIRKVAAVIVPFLIVTVGYPVVVDQGWTHYNPYILPLVALAAWIFGIIFIVSTDFCHCYAIRLLVLVRGKKGRAGMLAAASFAVIGAGIGAVTGVGYFFAIRTSKEHLANLRPETIPLPHISVPTKDVSQQSKGHVRATSPEQSAASGSVTQPQRSRTSPKGSGAQARPLPLNPARAYIALHSMDFESELSIEHEAKVKAVFIVSGQVPAFGVVMRNIYLYSDKFKTDPSDRSSAPHDIGDVPPGEFPYTFILKPLSPVQLADINRGAKKLYLYGFIEYRDANNGLHVQSYCATYSPTEFAASSGVQFTMMKLRDHDVIELPAFYSKLL